MIIPCSKSELFSLAFSLLVQPIDKLLYIGCGIRPYTYVNAKNHICCEPFHEYVNILKTRFPTLGVLNIGWDDVVESFKDKSVDTILLLDVIEHLDKDKGMDLLLKTIPIVKQNLVVFTPLGFLEQSHPDGVLMVEIGKHIVQVGLLKISHQ